MARPLRTKSSQVLLELLSKPIAFHRVFVKIGGSVAAAVLLSQAFYWSKNGRAKERDGWFYKSHVEWEEETGLTRREQQTARKHLQERGLLEEKDGSLPGKGRVLWYRVNLNALTAALAEAADGAPEGTGEGAQGVAPQRPTPLHENARPVAPQRPTRPITSETTPTTTSKTTHTRLRVAGAPEDGVCVSVFSNQFRERYADHFKLGQGWFVKSKSGERDEDILTGVRRSNLFELAATWGDERDAEVLSKSRPAQAQPSGAPAAQRLDYSKCPDCSGTGMYYPEGFDKGVTRCKHSRLTNAA